MSDNRSTIHDFLTVTCEETWHKAYNLGKKAQEQGLPRDCNLTGSPYCYMYDDFEKQLKSYKNAWEQGYDGSRFRDMIPIKMKEKNND